jgi:hypothetical protein
VSPAQTLRLHAAAGNPRAVRDGHGLFWFRGNGKGGWRLVQECGLPASGLSKLYSVALEIRNILTPDQLAKAAQIR